jgi:hypothetical protein
MAAGGDIGILPQEKFRAQPIPEKPNQEIEISIRSSQPRRCAPLKTPEGKIKYFIAPRPLRPPKPVALRLDRWRFQLQVTTFKTRRWREMCCPLK